jgi:GAF domain-containing protein
VRERQLLGALDDLADAPVEDLDVTDLMRTLVCRCGELEDVVEAGLVLRGPDPDLRLSSTAGQRPELLRLLEHGEGPWNECLHSGHPVSCDDLSKEHERWPRLAPHAVAQGLHTVIALPMRLRGQVVGALNLFGSVPGVQINPAAVLMAQAMADMATIALMQSLLAHSRGRLNHQLQTALDSRIKIEQAKGVVAERLSVGMNEAFELLRHQARSTHRLLIDVADEVASRHQNRNAAH